LFAAALAAAADAGAAPAPEAPAPSEPAKAEPEKPVETKPEPPAEPPKEEKPPEPPAEAAETELAKARRILAAAEKAQAEAEKRAKAGEDSLLELVRKSPTEFLRRAGLTLDQLLVAIADGGEQKPPTADDRMATLEKRIAEFEAATKQAQAEAAAAKEQAAIDARKREIHDSLRTADAAAKYPLIQRGQAWSEVTDLMVAYHAQHGQALPVERAAAEVEKYLQQLAGGNAPAPVKTEPAPPPRPNTVTLTNDAVRGAPPTGDPYSLTDDDARLSQVLRDLSRATAN
jgi:hypothetical protein